MTVLLPQLDRLADGKPSLASCESKELPRLVDDYDLLDAVMLNTHVDYESNPDPLTHYTYWSRIDRERTPHFYNNHTASQQVPVTSRIEAQKQLQRQRDRQGSLELGRTLQPSIANLNRFYKTRRLATGPTHFQN
ncbi:hypothetical protein PHMEG_0002218 [Phytophthora megakarya]|uniref:Uncharacterized protein n=1 Tax=Phytophthora megakarya TaxID=4795 RepID=A0A225X152_9STRA|nr:hypothetical protein PHMEG_0002218 [Phytophthora megakarya]